jgi:16S rRNA G527 N7-methylase RsmG
VGSGAGFPGIPIAILRPECSITLIESHQRKGVFLREASRNLKNVTVLTDRAENLKTEYDCLVSRAVSPKDLLKLKLANNLALLVGSEEIPGCDHWEPIPWGTGRYLVFHVKHP